MKNKIFPFFIIFPFITSCLNPFKKYAHNFYNVKWVSNEDSSIDLTIYVLGKDQTYDHLCIFKKGSIKEYCICGFEDYLGVHKIDEKGIVNEGTFYTTRTSLTKDNIYKAKVDVFYKDYFVSVGIKKKDVVSLHMEDFNPEKEATALMFSNANYEGDRYSFKTSNNISEIRDEAPFVSFFVSYGTMVVNEEKISVGLKFMPDYRYLVFKNNNLEDIVFSGTYSNKWTDVTLNLDTNNIDETKELNIKVDFLR